MPRDTHHLQAVLAAAQRLLDMRDAEQVTAPDWDGLKRAVAAASAPARGGARTTKGDLLKLLEPYGPDEQVVFVTFADGVTVYEQVEVAKDHCTKRRGPDGGLSMPVAIYLVDEGQRGKPGVMGLKPGDILPGGWPDAGDTPQGANEP